MGSHFNFKNFGSRLGEDNNMYPSGNSSLARQSSIYSLTFDEFQNAWGGNLGKDFGSINMDELLKTIWSAEETQAMTNSVGIGDASTSAGNLQRQGSLTLPRTLSQKTVDEVWRDLFKENNGGTNIKDGNGGLRANAPHKEPTLGEMTLEDFLARAGVVREDFQQMGRANNVGFFGDLSQSSNPNSGVSFPRSNQNDELLGSQIVENNSKLAVNQPLISATNTGRGISFLPQQQIQQQQPLLPKPVTVGFSSPMQLGNNVQLPSLGVKRPLVGIPNPSSMESNADSPSPSPVPGVLNRGRKASAALEKVIERRQKRMIKNRESAARSRARKQAYTLELEAEIAKLKEMNEELLRKQAEIIERQNNQLVETMKKRACLRRTLTANW